MAFSLERFERLVYRREHDAACRELLSLLVELDTRRGGMPPVGEVHAPARLTAVELDAHLSTRIAAAITALLGDPMLRLAPDWQRHVLARQRWLSAIFAASVFGHADHVIRTLSSGVAGDEIGRAHV